MTNCDTDFLRHDDHLNHRQEDVPWKREPAPGRGRARRINPTRRGPERQAAQDPEQHADQDLGPQPTPDEALKTVAEVFQRSWVEVGQGVVNVAAHWVCLITPLSHTETALPRLELERITRLVKRGARGRQEGRIVDAAKMPEEN